jgi:hypothetical protein
MSFFKEMAYGLVGRHKFHFPCVHVVGIVDIHTIDTERFRNAMHCISKGGKKLNKDPTTLLPGEMPEREYEYSGREDREQNMGRSMRTYLTHTRFWCI